jgi:hypothetical protein
VVTKTRVPVIQVEDVTRIIHDEDDFLRLAVGVLKAVDTEACDSFADELIAVLVAG